MVASLIFAIWRCRNEVRFEGKSPYLPLTKRLPWIWLKSVLDPLSKPYRGHTLSSIQIFFGRSSSIVNFSFGYSCLLSPFSSSLFCCCGSCFQLISFLLFNSICKNKKKIKNPCRDLQVCHIVLQVRNNLVGVGEAPDSSTKRSVLQDFSGPPTKLVLSTFVLRVCRDSFNGFQQQLKYRVLLAKLRYNAP